MTIGQQIKWNFETNDELKIKDKNGKLIYWELSHGYCAKWEYDSEGNNIYYENSNGDWAKQEYDSQGKLIYLEYSSGYWEKYEYDSHSNQIYFETSNGIITDKRPKPCENKVVEIDGQKYKLTKV